MSKVLKNRELSERPALRTLLAVSLCASLAAFGCTTDRTLGDGDPVVTPGMRNSPTGGASTGTETESVPPPMMSSYSGAQALPTVRPRVATVSAAEAAALLAEQHQPRVRVLGPASPNSGGRPYVSDGLYANTQVAIPERLTVNSTIYSPSTPAISSGAGEAISTDAGALFTDATLSTGTVATTGATSASSVAGTAVTNAGGAVIAPTTAASGTATANSFVAPPAFASVRTLSPTAAAVVNPPASVSASPTVATASSARTAGTAARSTTVSAGTAQAATTQSSVTATGVLANPIRVVNTNGRVTVTNVDRQQ